MKKMIVLLLLVTLGLLWTGYKKDSEDEDKNSSGEPVVGKVLNAQGQGLSGVLIELGSSQVYSEGDGSFRISNSEVMVGNRSVLEASLSGYMSSSYSFVKESGKGLETTMILSQADGSTTFSVGSGGTVNLNSGASVVIPSNGVMLMDGSAYTGSNVSVSVQEINEDKGIAFCGMVPGNTLTAEDAQGATQELYSYGMLKVELSGDNGEALQLAAGQYSTLTFAIPADQQSSAPSSIPLWYFDEEMGIWKEEGVATKQGNQYVGEVNHFTTWNVDMPHPACTITGCVEDGSGVSLSNIDLQVGQLLVKTDGNGCFSALIPAQRLPITVKYLDYNQLTSCDLYSLSTVVSPSTTYNVGTLMYLPNCGGLQSGWQINVPSSVLGAYGNAVNVVVEVVDGSGQGVSGVEVRSSSLSGGGSVGSGLLQTQGDGRATIAWTLGSSGGQELEVFVGTNKYIVKAGPIVLGTLTDARDGEEYETVTIGSQTWMAENLRYNAGGSWLNPSNPSSKYGRLYNWSTVMSGSSSSASVPSGVQGICPTGWHVPSDEEWKILEKSLGMSQSVVDNTGYRGTDQGTHLKSTSGWSNNGNGSNSSGFNAFPAGHYHSGSFYYLGSGAYFWSSTESSSSLAWYRYLYGGGSEVYRYSYGDKTGGFSCRCVEN